jgi:hypothetical protein
MDALFEALFRVLWEALLFLFRVLLEGLLEFLSWVVLQLVFTPLFYGPGWLVCAVTPFWREGARALRRAQIWAAPRADRFDPFYSQAANTVALIGFCATLVIGGAACGFYWLRG